MLSAFRTQQNQNYPVSRSSSDLSHLGEIVLLVILAVILAVVLVALVVLTLVLTLILIIAPNRFC